MRHPTDPVVRSSRREAIWVGIVWAIATCYTAGYCTLRGYDRAAESITYVYGFPDWFFGGIIVPWGISTAVTWAFAFWGMRDDVLGVDTDFVAGDDAASTSPRKSP